jgi:hypothetical protein
VSLILGLKIFGFLNSFFRYTGVPLLELGSSRVNYVLSPLCCLLKLFGDLSGINLVGLFGPMVEASIEPFALLRPIESIEEDLNRVVGLLGDLDDLLPGLLLLARLKLPLFNKDLLPDSSLGLLVGYLISVDLLGCFGMSFETRLDLRRLLALRADIAGCEDHFN